MVCARSRGALLSRVKFIQGVRTLPWETVSSVLILSSFLRNARTFVDPGESGSSR